MVDIKREHLPLVGRSNIYDLFIPQTIEYKIRYLCSRINDREWSGLLFYKPFGNFEANSLYIECVDIYPMDVGSSVSTEFMMSPDVIAYMADNQELLDCQIGLIHSHHQMSTFFSSVDMDTLRTEGEERNHFLSLIVNNKGIYNAAITRRITQVDVVRHISYNTFNDEFITSEVKSKDEDQIIEWFPLNVIKDDEEYLSGDWLHRIDELENSKFNDSSPKYEEPLLISNNSGKLLTKSAPASDQIPYESEQEEEIIDELLPQLITGSVILPNINKVDVTKWADNMVYIYDRRFGKGSEGFQNFQMWAAPYVEFLCSYSQRQELEGSDMDIADKIARGLTYRLNKLKPNKYIEEYVNILKDFIYE